MLILIKSKIQELKLFVPICNYYRPIFLGDFTRESVNKNYHYFMQNIFIFLSPTLFEFSNIG